MKLTRNFLPSDFLNVPQRELIKIGSLLNLISQYSGGIYKTRLMKLLYLIDEASVEEIGVPTTVLEYNVAKGGPLAVNVWNQISTKSIFEEYISVVFDESRKGYFINPVGTPETKYFSEYELELIPKIVEKYNNVSTDDLIEHIHEKDGSLWKKMVVENEIDFEKENSSITSHKIDLSDLIKEDELKRHFFNTFKNTRLH